MGGVIGLLDRARDAGLDVTSDGGKLVIRGPRQAEAIARELIGRKDEVLGALAGEPCDGETGEFAPPTWEELAAMRWGPGVGDPDATNLIVPHDWRSVVAGLPHEQWKVWRDLATSLGRALGHRPDAEEIGRSGRDAAIMMGYAE